MNKIVKTTDNSPTKTTLKTGFRRTLGLIILFATVTLTSCTELFSPFLDFFK